MLSNKQSFLLCAFVVFGFSISGMLDILNSYVVISILVFAFVAVVINIFLQKDKILGLEDEDVKPDDIE